MAYQRQAIYCPAVTLAETVAAWLKATGKAQNAVAKAAGLAPTKISDFANGKNKNPRLKAIEQLAKGFGVPAYVFLRGPAGHRAGKENVEDAVWDFHNSYRQLDGEERATFVRAVLGILGHQGPYTERRTADRRTPAQWVDTASWTERDRVKEQEPPPKSKDKIQEES